MRIIGGTAKGRKLVSPKGLDVRPMMDRVREAVFSMLTHLDALHGRVLDLYSGTGAVGMEALSRGMEEAHFVERDPRAVAVIWQNLRALGFDKQAQVHRRNVEDVLTKPHLLGTSEPFDLISVTPPYQEEDYNWLVPAVAVSPFVKPGTIVLVEYPRELGHLPEHVGRLHMLRDRQYGRTRVAIYEARDENEQRAEEEELEP
ncbi:MAG: 16S rRNA (guanine(966)-N(2))-methyltransferase RsmD [Ardenticatenia bacterium]|nr:MAG: 16S rRNA (guanine(966)-N(2))-methyltransferase RsmD [Ardenticatenia bacterium]